MSMSVRRVIAAVVGLGMVLAVPGVGPASASGPQLPVPPGQGQGDVLGTHDKELLAAAQADGKRTVELLVIADPDRAEQVAVGIADLGGRVEFREDSVGYLRAAVPLDRVDKVSALHDVAAVDVDEVLPVEPATTTSGRRAAGKAQPGPGAGTPRNNPYLPTQDVGTSQFTTLHPTWDGRGVRIAVVGTGVDLQHPALQTTTTGEPKVVDWVTATDPGFIGGVNVDDDPTWIQMSSEVAADPTFDGGTWTAPAPGTYRFGVFNERDPRLGGELGNDVDRDGNPAGSSGLFGVLWDPATGAVYVDADQDHSFADEAAMTDYGVNHDIGSFGTDNPATPVRETVPFVVQTSAATQSVNIGLVSGAQDTHVAGVLAGNDVFGGRADGAAPGAQLLSLRACLFVAGCTNHALIEGVIYAAIQGDADVIDLSYGQLPALNDANNARAELYDSLIDTYGVQIVAPAGDDGAGLNTVNDPAVTTKVVAVGSYVSKRTRLSNYGVVASRADTLDPASSAGPREDGGFKPQLVAPGSAVSTTPTWQAGRPAPGTYALPPGLGMLDGTSVAAAQVAGAAAVLMSAAEKTTGVTWSPALLRLALGSSSKFLNGYPAYRQGAGLLRTNAAWQVLRNKPHPVEISAAVETHTVLSGFLKVPGVGVGIYDREGVAVGDTYTRTYELTRTTGPATPTTAVLSWTGNDGTFGPGVKLVRLPKNQPVQVPITVKVRTAGVHSAILNLNDLSSPGTELRTLNTVVAPYEIDQGSPSRRIDATVARGQTQSYFFRVAPGTSSLSVELAGRSGRPLTGQLRFLRFHPYGTGVDDNGDGSCFVPAVDGCSTGSPTSRTTDDPAPGVWEVVVEARRTSTVQNVPFSLTVAGLGVTVSPDPDIIAGLTLGAPTTRPYTVTNEGGAFVGHATGSPLGSAYRATPTIADGAQAQFPVTVTPGTTQLRAAIGNPGDPAVDLDLFIYSCVSGTCVLRAQSAGSTAEESAVVNNPAPGVWVMLVDGFNVPGGTSTYDYVDVLSNPAYGSITVADTDAPRASGASWQVDGTIVATAAPSAGRVLTGSVQVTTSTGARVGSNDVVVQAVE